MISALLVQPHKAPVESDVKNELGAFQEITGGMVDFLDSPIPGTYIVCNEDAKYCKMPLNRALKDWTGKIKDIIAGDFLIVGATRNSLVSLSDQQKKACKDYWGVPQKIRVINDKIVVIPEDTIGQMCR